MKNSNVRSIGTYLHLSQEKYKPEDLKHTWKQVQNHLEKHLSKPSFETWIKNTALINLDDLTGEVVIAVPNEFARDWLETRYTKLIKEALYYLTNRFYRIMFIERIAAIPKDEFELLDFLDTLTLPLNPNRTFQSFTTTHNNLFAKIAAETIAETFNKAYNPLIIWGPAHSGKTHLLQAVGNNVISENPESEIIHITAEHFINAVERSSRLYQMNILRKSFQKANIVLFDDIHLIEDNEKIQFELSNIMIDSFNNDIQIVFTSFKNPRELDLFATLKEQILSGLVTEVELESPSPSAIQNSSEDTNTILKMAENITTKKDEDNLTQPTAVKEDNDILITKINQLIQEQEKTNEWLEKIFEKL
ncbi:MAG TPA: ATP-binding protein [Bacillales bacterium]|nr:ATP-binding protein [Bacillales bacterium]